MCKTKICKVCKNEWDLEIFFPKHNATLDGYENLCKGCLSLKKKGKVYDGSKKTCLLCNKEKTTLEFSPAKRSKDGFRSFCRICWDENDIENKQRENPNYVESIRRKIDDSYKKHIAVLTKESRQRNAQAVMFRASRQRARNKGIPFGIDKEDIIIPEYCPVLGVKLEWGSAKNYDNSPSLDRVITKDGYIKGNIQVISSKANTMKSNATPEELLKLAEWINKTFKEKYEKKEC